MVINFTEFFSNRKISKLFTEIDMLFPISILIGKSSKILEWSVRYKIALGIAKGLHYLHECCKHRIIHRDIKASNVLLGPDYEPQVTY